ncbi:WD40 repeat domain-containing protein [Sansalvadorimonas sp. 2012CJ34-2]|uniref:WD40 repeat domain-containing protein n=1 Tax=Parendozoicomonas callyspongiae TaxID=2942213 RepID=A0ABT0PHD4_9GAMM|nr:WD40 repeat domain-containing protein [Sansalvadorimonas sp. 2012CJ34-2]MCL6269908.1 WD40 repeat domain-containing protein [Sansalvadorimonas sp. 2012CJ34-2]
MGPVREPARVAGPSPDQPESKRTESPVPCSSNGRKAIRVMEPGEESDKIKGEQFFNLLGYDCWQHILTYLTARDVRELRQVCKYFYLNDTEENPFGISQNQCLTSDLVEKYYHSSPKIQSRFRNNMPSKFSRECQPEAPFGRWLEKHFTEKERAWVMRDVLRQGALLRYLSNRAGGVETITTLKGHTGMIRCLATFLDGRVLSGSYDKTLKVWDLTRKSGQECIATLTGHSSWVLCVAILPGGQVVSGSCDNTLKIWDLTREPGQECIATLTGHRDRVRCVVIASNERVISGSDDHTLKLWDLTQIPGHECIATLDINEWIMCVAAASDRRVFSGSTDEPIKCWDLTGEPGHECIATLKGHDRTIACLTIAANEQVISGSDDKTLKVWDLTGEPGQECIATLAGHRGLVSCVVIAPDGRAISGSNDQTLKIWDTTRALGDMCAATLAGLKDQIRCVATTSEGLVIFSQCIDEALKVWNPYQFADVGKGLIEKTVKH